MDSPLLVDMAIHTFDAARYVTGADPVSVQCAEFNPPWSWYRGSASAIAEFEFEDGLRLGSRGAGAPTASRRRGSRLGVRSGLLVAPRGTEPATRSPRCARPEAKELSSSASTPPP